MLWLCWSAIWIASSSVMLVGPVLWANAELISARASTRVKTTDTPNFRSNTGLFKGRLRFWKLIAISRDPDIKRRQQNNAEEQVGNQSADDHDSKRPLGIRTDVMR